MPLISRQRPCEPANSSLPETLESEKSQGRAAPPTKCSCRRDRRHGALQSVAAIPDQQLRSSNSPPPQRRLLDTQVILIAPGPFPAPIPVFDIGLTYRLFPVVRLTSSMATEISVGRGRGSPRNRFLNLSLPGNSSIRMYWRRKPLCLDSTRQDSNSANGLYFRERRNPYKLGFLTRSCRESCHAPLRLG